MTQTENLKIYERDTTITPRKLRTIGYTPATIYGKNFEPVSVQVKTHDLELAIARGVRHYKLDGAGQNIEAELKQVDKHSGKATLIHVEFYVAASADSKKSTPKAAAHKATHTEQQSSTKENLETQSLSEAVEAVPVH